MNTDELREMADELIRVIPAYVINSKTPNYIKKAADEIDRLRNTLEVLRKEKENY